MWPEAQSSVGYSIRERLATRDMSDFSVRLNKVESIRQ